MAWTPKGYQHIRDWLEDELKRRGQQDDPEWTRAFDDLADFLTDEWTQAGRFAIFVYESGVTPSVVPLTEWRKSPPEERARMADRRLFKNYSRGGFGSAEPGYVAIRKDLRLDMEPNAQEMPAQPTQPAAAPKSTQLPPAQLARYMAELNQQYANKPIPGLEEIKKAGRARFGTQWRKGFENEKNAEDPATGAPLYPHLYRKNPGRPPSKRG